MILNPDFMTALSSRM